MDLGLKGKIALVTGSTGGMGYAIAQTLAEEGAKVMINGRNAEKVKKAAGEIQRKTGVEVAQFTGDITDHAFGLQAVNATIEAYGGLDLLVTNAGGPPSGKFESFDDAAWQNALEVCFLGHVRLIRASLPYLKKSDCGSVVAITSLSVRQPVPGLVLSTASRSATTGLMKSLALELGSEGIRFNSILPAWTRTERAESLLKARADLKGIQFEEEINHIRSESALGRLGKPEEVARAAVFFLSPAASYLTGVSLNVDGGIYRSI